MNIQISIKDENSARQWLQMVEGINQDYFQAMKDAADCLSDMQNFADGTMIDEFVNFASEMLKAVDKTYDTIKEIANTVTAIVGKVKDFAEGVVSGVKAITKIFGG